MSRPLLSIGLLAIVATTASADERYEFPGQDWGRRPHAARYERSEYGPPRRNFGAINLHPQRVTRRPNPNLLFRNGGWGFGFPWGYYFPFGWGYFAPWGWGPFWGGWGPGFNSWSYRFGFVGGGPARSSNGGWAPGPTQLSDGWFVSPQGLAREAAGPAPTRESLRLAGYDGCYYW